MKKLYRFGATTFAVMAAFAAVGAGLLIVATAVVIGGIMALAAKLAISGAKVNQDHAVDVEDAPMQEPATA